ncbi:MAG: SsrA-binding protein [Parcubacteria group bacterium GW2011_GWA1_47_8]|nr:MAG: SsrA-binding protein [Parcubacteria group bacterium GW2011_GWA1_47_8]KKW07559.1 MAG: SsrA-binding protein [Parcubacteria group bacterium GW2011_GWA2_49_16]
MALIENKKIYFNYEVLTRYEAGIELLGLEVKSLRGGRGSLEGSHVTVRGGEAFLVGATINPYQPGNTEEGYDPMRNRRLILTKPELAEIAAQESKKGLTIVPISVYNKKRKIKVEIAIVRGKKTQDKRETIKKREAGRDILRDLKFLRSEAS